MVDSRKAGNAAKQGDKCLKMQWISTGIYLVCRHMQEQFMTCARIYGRGSVMLRLANGLLESLYIRLEYFDLITPELIGVAA